MTKIKEFRIFSFLKIDWSKLFFFFNFLQIQFLVKNQDFWHRIMAQKFKYVNIKIWKKYVKMFHYLPNYPVRLHDFFTTEGDN